jgi:hypothetical protein
LGLQQGGTRLSAYQPFTGKLCFYIGLIGFHLLLILRILSNLLAFGRPYETYPHPLGPFWTPTKAFDREA